MPSKWDNEELPDGPLEGAEPCGGRRPMVALPRICRPFALGFLLCMMGAQDPSGPVAASPRRLPQPLNFANGLFRQRKFDLAAEEYQRFLEGGASGQDADDARFGLASARLFQGRYKEARETFRAFLDKAPDHPRARTAGYRLGELGYMLGDLEAARKALETFTSGPAGHPNLETAWTYLGDVCYALNDSKRARAAYERALEDFPKGQLADRSRYGLGRAFASLDQSDEALKVFTGLASKGGTEWLDKAWFQVALIQLSAGRSQEALEALATIEHERPASPLMSEVWLRRGEALKKLGRVAEAEKILKPLAADATSSLAAEASLFLATLWLEQNRAEESLSVLDDALSRFPKSTVRPALLFRSAEACQRLKRADDARARYLKVVDADPTDAWAADSVLRASRLAMEAGDHESARKLAASFPARFPASKLGDEMRLVEARASLSAGQSKEGIAILEDLLGIGKPADPSAPARPASALTPTAMQAARYELAVAYRSGGEAARAEALLAGLASSPTGSVSTDAAFLVGQGHVEAGRHAEAIGPLRQYLKASPKGGVADYALSHLVTAQIALGQIDEASKSLGELVERFPRSKALPASRVRVAEAALAGKKMELAAAQFRQALEPVPTGKEEIQGAASSPGPLEPSLKARAQAGLGWSLWALRKPAEAAEAFSAVMKDGSRNSMTPDIALAVGQCRAEAGQTQAALESLEAVSRDYPGSEQASKADLSRARLLARSDRPALASDLFRKLLADESLRKALEAGGEKPDVLLADWGWALVDADRGDEADGVFAELLKKYPSSQHAVDARFNLAESANQAKNHEEVVRLLAPLVDSPDGGKPDEPGHERQGSSAPFDALVLPGQPADPGKKSDAGAEGRPASDARRLTPLILYRLGRTHVELRDWAAAATCLDRLIADYPDCPRIREARYLRAEAALGREDARTAEPLLAKLGADPGLPSDPAGFGQLIRTKHVQSLLALKRWKDALTEAESLKSGLTDADPAFSELDYSRGRALLGLGRMEEARSALEAVIAAGHGSELAAQAQLLRGETFFHEEKYREALREYRQVDVLYDAPRWQAVALLELGKVYERLAEWSEAAEAYTQLDTRFPKDPHSAEARSRLELVRKREVSRNETEGRKS